MRKYIALSVLGIFVFGMLAFFYQHSQSQLYDEHNSILQVLLIAKQAETNLEKDLLKSRNYLVLTYDPLVASVENVEKNCTRLSAASTYLYKSFKDSLDKTIEKYCSAVEKKLKLIEEFKSKNAILTNSVYYIQKLATEANTLDRSGRAKELAYKNRLLKLTLAYSVVSTFKAREELASILAKPSEPQKASFAEVENIMLHAAKILETKERLDLLTKEIESSASSQLLDEARQTYLQSYSSAEKIAKIYRRLLFGACTLFLLFIFYNITLLWRAAKKLTDANLHLEDKVIERTRELEQSKATIMQHQQSLIYSAKLSSLGEMAGGIAHEINTPLAIISMRTEQIEELIADGNLDEFKVLKNLHVIKSTTNRIAKIIAGLRFFASDAKKAPTEPISISKIIEETLSLCREKFSSHGVEIEVKNESSVQPYVECRPIELSQVFLNLLNNSFDAVSEQAEKWVRVEIKDQDPYVEVSFVDSGVGISSEIQDKIMQPFFTTKDIGKGTGLGLSISRGIIESHQGKLQLAPNHPNTCFRVLLPKTQLNAS